MNKRELINYIAEQQELSWDQPTTYEQRSKIYEQCKDICKQNGYIGGTFEQLWNAATRQRATGKGIYRG